VNDYGNNFIINEQIQSLGLIYVDDNEYSASATLNNSNTWVKPDSVLISSVFMESITNATDKLDIFAAFRFDNHPNWGNHVSPRLGAFYQLSTNQQFRLSWQEGFRSAVGIHYSGGFVQDGFLSEQSFTSVNDVSDLYADFNWDGIAANDTNTLKNVRPEIIENLELSYRYHQENWSLSSVYFINTVKDIITAEAHGYQTLQPGDLVGTDPIGTWAGHWYYQNQQGELNQHGIELELDYQDDNLRLSGSHSFVAIVDADDTTIGPYVLSNKQNASYPEHVTRLQAHYSSTLTTGIWKFHINHTYYWQYYAPNLQKVDGSHILNGSLAWKKNSDSALTVKFSVKNILNTDGLYPINGTGDLINADGTPSIEQRTWWLEFDYQF
jgi:outer membrane receptor protein involved in Fe transport